LESSIKTSLKIKKMNSAESEFSKRKTRNRAFNRLLGADIATDQTKPFRTDVSPRKETSSEANKEEE
jgi:hypothetical protein